MVSAKSVDYYLTAPTESSRSGTTCEWRQNRYRMADYEGMNYPRQAASAESMLQGV